MALGPSRAALLSGPPMSKLYVETRHHFEIVHRVWVDEWDADLQRYDDVPGQAVPDHHIGRQKQPSGPPSQFVANARSTLCMRATYFVTTGGALGAVLGDKASVTHAFQPDGLFSAANSQYPFTLRYAFTGPAGMMNPTCGPMAATCDSLLPRNAAAPWSGVICW